MTEGAGAGARGLPALPERSCDIESFGPRERSLRCILDGGGVAGRWVLAIRAMREILRLTENSQRLGASQLDDLAHNLRQGVLKVPDLLLRLRKLLVLKEFAVGEPSDGVRRQT